jgi:hypothetical protein
MHLGFLALVLPYLPCIRQPVRQPFLARSVPKREQRRQLTRKPAGYSTTSARETETDRGGVMFCAFLTLLMLCGGVGVLAWLGWQRVAAHLNNDAEAKEYFVEHVIAPMLLGEKEPKAEDKPEPKKTKETPI